MDIVHIRSEYYTIPTTSGRVGESLTLLQCGIRDLLLLDTAARRFGDRMWIITNFIHKFAKFVLEYR